MSNLRPGPLAVVLEANRPRFNALFAQARRTMPNLDPAAFGQHLTQTLAPIADAVANVAPELVSTVVNCLYEISLDMLGTHILGPKSRYPALAEGWGLLLLGLPQHLAASPRAVVAAITNALYNLVQQPTTRPREWIDLMLSLGPQCKDVATLLELGRVAAWRAGMAHYRAGALVACCSLPPALAGTALGLPAAVDGATLEGVLSRLEGDPWLTPASAARATRQPEPPHLVGRVGAFRGFGGLFLNPPRVFAAGGQLFVADSESCWLLTADVFGATFHRAVQERPKVGGDAHGSFKIDKGGTVTRGQLARRFEELGDAASVAATATTLAVTMPRSHAVYLVA